jgi:hypothetical protein
LHKPHQGNSIHHLSTGSGDGINIEIQKMVDKGTNAALPVNEQAW